MTPRPFIRQLLTRYPDGLTVREIAEAYAVHKNKPMKRIRQSIEGCLKSPTRVAYIDRYIPVKFTRHAYRWAAVWCLIDWPEDAPRPTTKAGDHVR